MVVFLFLGVTLMNVFLHWFDFLFPIFLLSCLASFIFLTARIDSFFCLLVGYVKATTYTGIGGQGSTWERVAF
jgi:hypothetical protein